jgi:hypothetical protein
MDCRASLAMTACLMRHCEESSTWQSIFFWGIAVSSSENIFQRCLLALGNACVHTPEETWLNGLLIEFL